MKKLSIINENIFDGIGKRSKGGIVRKEDQGIIIGSVMWSNTDVVVGNKELFTYEEAESFEKNGWRLPTTKEADELLSKSKYSYDEDKQFFILSNENVEEIYLKRIPNEKNKYKKNTQYWDKKTECLNKLFIEKDNKFFPHTPHAMAYDDELCRIRLVRDI